MDEDYSEGQRLCQQGAVTGVQKESVGLAAWGLSLISCWQGDYHAACQHLRTADSFFLYLFGQIGILIRLPAAAMILASRGGGRRAVELLALAFTHPLGVSGWMEKWPLLERFRTDLRLSLGEKVYADAWERGQQLDLSAAAVELESLQATAPPSAQQANQKLADPLTERELDVLRLLANGLNNRAIAQQLTFTVGTVKWYLHEIYTKLHVSSRAEAIRRARDLNLLS